MPTLLDERVITLEFSDLLARRPITRPDQPPRRSGGLHQSGILAHIARKIGKLKPDEKDESEYPILWALGQAWEEYVFSFYPQVVWQPGERSMDGIAVNCDGLTDDRVVEAKATYKSSDKDFLNDPKQWIWLHQGREYCYQYDRTVEQWHVLHLRGDYKSFGPVYKTYTVRFEESELLGTHKMLLSNMESARKDGLEERS